MSVHDFRFSVWQLQAIAFSYRFYCVEFSNKRFTEPIKVLYEKVVENMRNAYSSDKSSMHLFELFPLSCLSTFSSCHTSSKFPLFCLFQMMILRWRTALALLACARLAFCKDLYRPRPDDKSISVLDLIESKSSRYVLLPPPPKGKTRMVN